MRDRKTRRVQVFERQTHGGVVAWSMPDILITAWAGEEGYVTIDTSSEISHAGSRANRGLFQHDMVHFFRCSVSVRWEERFAEAML